MHYEKKARRLAALIRVAAAFCCLVPALAEASGPTLQVGSETDFPPYADVDADGKATGFSVELFAAAAAAANLPVEFVPDQWDALWRDLKRGKIDALPLVARLPERDGQVEFTAPHTWGFDAFFVRKGGPVVGSIAEASQLRIIVMRSDAAHDALLSRGFGPQLVPVSNLADGFRLLASGQHDVLLAPVVQGIVQSDAMGLHDAIDHGPMLKEYRREFCFAVARGNTELRDRLQSGLDIVKANGEYERLYRKWLGTYEPSRIPRHILWSAGALLAILALLAAWTWSLRRQVASRTAELKAHRDNLEHLVAERTSQLGKAMAEAQAATAAKTAFLANMSHEIRTPLHVISGLAHLMRRHVRDAGMMQRLDQVCANSDHLQALVSNILDMSKIEAGEFALDSRTFRLQTVIDQMLSVVAVPARTKGLALQVEVAPELANLPVQGDPLRLAQVLINLCSNATKFTDRGFIRLGIAGDRKGDELALSFTVEDTGCGIPDEIQSSVFQPFKQGDDSSTRVRGGTGLGLTISQRLVEMMGGSIRLASQPGKGSRFWFDLTLPMAAEDEPADSTPPRPADGFRGTRVLLADDHPISQEIVFEMLKDLGCTVDIASDGVEAVAQARERPYDLILMDIQMPRMDGLQAARTIRSLSAHLLTPIVALTSNVFAEDRQQCLDAGMDDHIGKPITPAALADSLSRWLPGTPAARADGPATEHAEPADGWRGIPGLEVPGNWRRSAAHMATYRDQLTRFLSRHQADMASIEACIAANDRQAAERLLHDLKGVSGLLGARRVAACIAAIELRLRSDDTAGIDLLIEECRQELAALAAGVAALPEAAATEKA